MAILNLKSITTILSFSCLIFLQLFSSGLWAERELSSARCLSYGKLQLFQKEVEKWDEFSRDFLDGIGLNGKPALLSKFFADIEEAVVNPKYLISSAHPYLIRYLPVLKNAVDSMSMEERKKLFPRIVKAINTRIIASSIIPKILTASPDETILGICRDNGVLVAIAIHEQDSVIANHRYLKYILSTPDTNVKGAGTALILEMISKLALRGEGISLKATLGSEGFYKNLGFKPCEHDHGFFCRSSVGN